MATVANKRSIMTLFSKPLCADSHRARIVLAEKGINHDVITVEPGVIPEDLIELNPYQTVPTLVDRELVLYDSHVVMEYLDERFPHPPLMPVDPVSRAKIRLALFRIEKDWYSLLDPILNGTAREASQSRKILKESILASSEVFDFKPFFLSDEFTLVDACIAPILWRLSYYGVDLGKKAKPINDYAKRIFSRDAFQLSLSELEREIGSDA